MSSTTRRRVVSPQRPRTCGARRAQAEQALKLNEYAALKRPDDPLANSQLGMAEFALGQFDAAEKHLLKAVKLDPAHFSHPQLQLAELYLRRKQPARAAEQLEDFLLRHPDWPGAAAMREGIAKLRAQ